MVASRGISLRKAIASLCYEIAEPTKDSLFPSKIINKNMCQSFGLTHAFVGDPTGNKSLLVTSFLRFLLQSASG